MENLYNFTWRRKNIFSKTWTIYCNNAYFGSIERSFFGKKSLVEIDGKRYEFRDKIKMNFKSLVPNISETEIVGRFETPIGKIKYSDDGQDYESLRGFIDAVRDQMKGKYKPQAFIDINDETSVWAFYKDDGWGNKWIIKSSAGLKIAYESSNYKKNGTIESNRNDALKVISGLYVNTTMFRDGLIGGLFLLIYVPLVTVFFILIGDPLWKIINWIF